MAMTEKQIYRRMSEAWNELYSQYEDEAEWYGDDNSHIWRCDIPSKGITIKMEMDEKKKIIKIYERPYYGEWEKVNSYKW